MNQATDIDEILGVAEKTISAAGCASLITVDDDGLPSSRPVAAFAPDARFSRIVIGSDTGSRKVVHIRKNPHVVLSYIDLENRGYVTAIGEAVFSNDLEEKKEYWTERFTAFFPGGPGSDEYNLIIVVPRRIELRSFGLNVAAVPNQWSPVILERDPDENWQRIK